MVFQAKDLGHFGGAYEVLGVHLRGHVASLYMLTADVERS